MSILHAAVTRHKKLVVAIFAAATVVCVLLQFGVSVNYNLTDYLPADAQSTKALEIMKDEFPQAVPNARVMLRGVTVQEALDYKEKLKKIDGVSDVVWLDDVVDLKQPLEMADRATVENYYKDNTALISLTIREGDEVAVTDAIYRLIGEQNALSGSAVDRAHVQKLAGTETRNATLILIPVVFLILLVTTSSWLEPLLYLCAIGISVLINMGTNVFFGEISFVTRTVSPILQLAVSLDYAIFLLHSFEEYKKKTADLNEAMRLAMRRAFRSIAASAATTLFGFVALVFMKFKIGSDLGICLVKGIILSFVSVVTFLPALTLLTHDLIEKTRHRPILPKFSGIGSVSLKARVPVLILVVLLIVPSFLAQSKNSFIYGAGELGSSGRSVRDKTAINEAFGESTPIVLLVPKGDLARESMLSDDLKSLDHVKEVFSYAATVGNVVPPEILDRSITERFYSEHYSRIIVYTDTKDEGDEAFATVEQVQAVARQYYGDSVYSCGQSVSLYDMRDVVTKDNKVVNAVAVISILLVLLATFRSLSLPAILLLTIESAIWLNLSIPYFSGTPLCYIGFLIINTVQLGATVDYAILTTNHYVANRAVLPKREALKKSLGETFISVLTSAAILSLASLTLWMTSSNQIVSELGMLLSRGTLLSMLMTVFFLPAALYVFDGVVRKTTFRARFFQGVTDSEKTV